MLFYGQRKRVWKTSFWSWKGDAASIMPGPYSLTVTILHQIKRWQFSRQSRQRVLKKYIYIFISFEDDIEILQESMQGGMELERHKNYDVDYRWRSSLSLGGWHSWCQSKKSLRCINAAGMIKSILLSSKTLQEINKHLPTTGKSCLLSTSKTTYKKSM